MIIAGAGIIGLSCAWQLARAGTRVTIFDARECGAEASWAGAGMLAPGGEIHDEILAPMALRSLALYPQFISELQDATGMQIDYRRDGALEIALSEGEARLMETRARRQAALGIESEPAGPNVCEACDEAVAARFYPSDAVVNPREVTAALKLACMRAGVEIKEHEPVLQVLPKGLGVRTSCGEYRSDGVLIAAGAWSSALCQEVANACAYTFPVRGHLIAFGPLPIPHGPIVRSGSTYLLQRRNGLVIAGSSTEHVGFDRTIDEHIVSDLHKRASRLWPVLASEAPRDSWNGFRPGIGDHKPAIGRIEDTRIWTAFGHYRNGILLAPETARMITDSVVGL